MTTQRNGLQALFPNVPRESPEVDKSGNFTQMWSLFFGALSQALQDNFKAEGIMFPWLSQADATTIQQIYKPALIGLPLPQTDPSVYGQAFIPDISGQTIFNTDTRLPQQFIITFDTSTPPLITEARWYNFNLTPA